MGPHERQLLIRRGHGQGGAQGPMAARRGVGVRRQARVPRRLGDPGGMLEDTAVGLYERVSIERCGCCVVALTGCSRAARAKAGDVDAAADPDLLVAGT